MGSCPVSIKEEEAKTHSFSRAKDLYFRSYWTLCYSEGVPTRSENKEIDPEGRNEAERSEAIRIKKILVQMDLKLFFQGWKKSPLLGLNEHTRRYAFMSRVRSLSLS
jgi:hypothetical protein